MKIIMAMMILSNMQQNWKKIWKGGQYTFLAYIQAKIDPLNYAFECITLTGMGDISDTESESEDDDDNLPEVSSHFNAWSQMPEFKALIGSEYQVQPNLALACLIQFDGDNDSTIVDKFEWCLDNEEDLVMVQRILESVSSAIDSSHSPFTTEKQIVKEGHRLPCEEEDIINASNVQHGLEESLHNIWINFKHHNDDDRRAKDFLNFKDLAQHLEVISVSRLINISISSLELTSSKSRLLDKVPYMICAFWVIFFFRM